MNESMKVVRNKLTQQMLDRFLDSDTIVIKANKTSIIKFENNPFTVFLSLKKINQYHRTITILA